MDNIEFRLVEIHIVSKTMNESPKEGQISLCDFDLRIENTVMAEKNLVIPLVYLTIREEKKPNILASFVVAYLFEIIDFEKHITLTKEKLYHIPELLNSIIHPVAISTTRGIAFSELRGTYLNNSILPIVFMNQLKQLEREPS